MKSVLLGLLLPFLGTAAGAACVFFLRRDLRVGVQRALTGFAAGVMTAASIWSLIVPAIDQSATMGRWAFLPAFAGFWLGVGFLLLLDHIIPHLHRRIDQPEGPKSRLGRTAMLVLLTSTGILKSRICRADTAITVPVLERFYNVTSSRLVGKPLSEMQITTMQTIAASLGADAFTLLPFLAGIAELAHDASQADVRLDGQSNLLGYRELEENAYELMEFLRKGAPLNALVSQAPADVQVLIGKENKYRQLANSSLILARYNVGGEESGTIGVIGPTRLDYAKLIPSVRYLTDLVGRLLTQSIRDEE